MDLRAATADDAADCAALYAPYVTGTAISFESEPPTAAEMADRIEVANDRHAWLVGTEAGEVPGYAYATTFKPRAAYRCTGRRGSPRSGSSAASAGSSAGGATSPGTAGPSASHPPTARHTNRVR